MSSSSRSSSRHRSSSSKSSRSSSETPTSLVSENLAVRYRPRVLEDLVGQDHIVSEIRGMFKRNRVPSSIMLAGPTGLGKTTTARILARYIICTSRDAKTHQPCGECANCKMENHPDVIELNAADTRGIDDVRKLIEQARNMPSMGAKRLFIIDECLPGDTLIELANGNFVPLVDIVADPTRYVVKTFNHETGKTEPQPVLAGWSTGTKPDQMMEIELEDGTKQLVSENHRWWSVTRNCYIRTDEIQSGEELQASTDK